MKHLCMGKRFLESFIYFEFHALYISCVEHFYLIAIVFKKEV